MSDDKPYEKGGPGDHYPDERSISGRACLPILIAGFVMTTLIITGLVQVIA